MKEYSKIDYKIINKEVIKIINQPVFIIGFPRSGTKLLRDLLNNHSKINIPEIETNFLPYMNKLVNNSKNLDDKKNFKIFYRKIIRTLYFLYQETREIKKIDINKWYDQCIKFDTAEIFRNLIFHDMNIEKDDVIIWGDKSPSYLRNVNLIKNLYPNAKIIHIVRDVRDICLSSRKTWGRNICYVAHRWNKSLTELNNIIDTYKKIFFELSYETLITDTKNQMINICKFLNIDYEKGMELPQIITENFGDARDMKKIKIDNKNKFMNELTYFEINEIEKIASENLKKYDYKLINNVKNIKNISKCQFLCYNFLDFLNLFYFRLKNENLNYNVKFYYYLLIEFVN